MEGERGRRGSEAGRRTARASPSGFQVMLIGRLLGIVLILLGFLAALAIFAGSFRADFVAGLPKLWLLFGVLCVIGTTLYSACSRAITAERTVRRMGIALLVLAFASGVVLWARHQGGVRVDAPVQLWLLFAVCLVTGGVSIYSSSV